jgi:hypothetical protein
LHTVQVDETTTVKNLLESLLPECGVIKQEPDLETFWLFSKVDDP